MQVTIIYSYSLEPILILPSKTYLVALVSQVDLMILVALVDQVVLEVLVVRLALAHRVDHLHSACLRRNPF